MQAYSYDNESRNLSPDDFKVMSLQPSEVPIFMNLADVGLGLIEPQHEDIGIKFAEYLAMGLPVVTNFVMQEFDQHARGAAQVRVHMLNPLRY